MIIRLFPATNEQFIFQQIMKDRWINAGHEEDELKPFVEPELDISDQKRIGNYSVCTDVCAHVCVHRNISVWTQTSTVEVMES